MAPCDIENRHTGQSAVVANVAHGTIRNATPAGSSGRCNDWQLDSSFPDSIRPLPTWRQGSNHDARRALEPGGGASRFCCGKATGVTVTDRRLEICDAHAIPDELQYKSKNS